jgi:regulator of RNase E activity RraA
MGVLTVDALSIIETLSRVSTATITTLLLKRGLRNVWMRGPRPRREGQGRVVGPAFTLRFIPAREDLATPEAWSSPRSTRVAIEDMPPGCVVVASAMGIVDAGIFGDILCARMIKRGVAGLITDGAVRDIAGVRATGLPIWSQGIAAPPSATGLIFEGWQQPVGCGGVAIYPGETIVADDDGAVVIPAAHLEHVAAAGPEQERLEQWIMGEVENGLPLPGLYPADAATRARYEAETGKAG